MATANDVSDLLLRIDATTEGLRRELKKAEQGVDKSTGKINKRVKLMDRRFMKMSRSVGKSMANVSKAIAGIGIAAGAGIAALVESASNAAREIDNLSTIAGTTPEKFQRMAFAAQTLNIEQGKLSDILKDMNDRVGDFLQTGGGPMADFFENIAPQVGVTAEQFRNLSGPDALQLYVSSLEKANLSQGEMTFFMEAIASDSTALIPLLRNNGREMERLGDEAERTGAVLSQFEIDQLAEVKEETDKLKASMTGAKNEIALGLVPEIRELTNTLNDPAVREGLTSLVSGLAKLATSAAKIPAVLGFIGDEISAWAFGPQIGDIVRLQDELEDLQRMRDQEAMGMRDADLHRNPWIVELDRRIALRKQEIELTKNMNLIRLKGQRAAPELVRQIEESGNVAARSGKDVEDYKDSLQSLLDKLNPGAAQVKEIREQWELLNKAISQGDAVNADRGRFLDEFVKVDVDRRDPSGAQEQMAAIVRDRKQAVDSLVQSLETERETAHRTYKEQRELINQLIKDDELRAELRTKNEQKLFERLKQINEEGQDELSAYAEQAARNIQDSFADFLFDPFQDGLEGMVQGFIDSLRRMIAEAAAADLASSIGLPGSGDGGNLASLFSTVSGMFGGGGGTDVSSLLVDNTPRLASFDGGGFTGNGPRFGGLDGKGGFPAIMHPQETVTDHTKPQQQATGTTNIYVAPAANRQQGFDTANQISQEMTRKMGRAQVRFGSSR